ncbi:MAG: hypothetical protein GOVbin556_43 [Prokaryotic dsDNA virus sp.]|nr:MAG: hypothetical protein GOVbin556_43 [Prokaryotic dsDNA virus sp.]|tara:strand:- start:151 stop:405 length:255 start_codon:yes stop_codon:yes gene_type:complete
MSVIYEILKDGQRLGGGSFYSQKNRAQEKVDQMNKNVIQRIMFEANRMNGAIRGANKDEFRNMIDQVAKPPYTVKKVLVDDSWR